MTKVFTYKPCANKTQALTYDPCSKTQTLTYNPHTNKTQALTVCSRAISLELRFGIS